MKNWILEFITYLILLQCLVIKTQTIFQKIAYLEYVPKTPSTPGYHIIKQAQSLNESILVEFNECETGDYIAFFKRRSAVGNVPIKFYKDNQPFIYEEQTKFVILEMNGRFSSPTVRRYYIWDINRTLQEGDNLIVYQYKLSISFCEAHNTEIENALASKNYFRCNNNVIQSDINSNNSVTTNCKFSFTSDFKTDILRNANVVRNLFNNFPTS